MQKKIHIDEENTQIIWGLVAVVAIAGATFMLMNAFMAGSWEIGGIRQLISMALFVIGFYGIVRVSSPLFHFFLRVSDTTLTIEIWKEGDQPLDVQTIELRTIQELRIAPHSPRSSNEARFDFTTDYHLLYRPKDSNSFRRLIALKGETFTLKVDDIKKIMRFLQDHQSEIQIPDDQKLFIEQ